MLCEVNFKVFPTDTLVVYGLDVFDEIGLSLGTGEEFLVDVLEIALKPSPTPCWYPGPAQDREWCSHMSSPDWHEESLYLSFIGVGGTRVLAPKKCPVAQPGTSQCSKNVSPHAGTVAWQ